MQRQPAILPIELEESIMTVYLIACRVFPIMTLKAFSGVLGLRIQNGTGSPVNPLAIL
jgi:hypothetical protein